MSQSIEEFVPPEEELEEDASLSEAEDALESDSSFQEEDEEDQSP